jgi:membrane protease YdiL (CAAX protease family)
MGVIYGVLEPHFTRFVHPRVRIRWALPVGAAFFALWHVPNVFALSIGYTAFQLTYVFVGFVLTGLSRQWTGSMLYATLTHSAVNWIASRGS